MAKLIKRGFNISGMETPALAKHYWTLWTKPFVDIKDGPKVQHICELLWLHSVGAMLARLEIKHPPSYRLFLRLQNSVVFRYNRYRNILLSKLTK